MQIPKIITSQLFKNKRKLVENKVDLVDYEEGRVVSRTFAQNPTLSITLFAFDKGEGVSTHTAPGDAMLQILDGEALVNIDYGNL